MWSKAAVIMWFYNRFEISSLSATVKEILGKYTQKIRFLGHKPLLLFSHFCLQHNGQLYFQKERHFVKKHTSPHDIWNSTACLSISAGLLNVWGRCLWMGQEICKLSNQRKKILARFKHSQDCIQSSYKTL